MCYLGRTEDICLKEATMFQVDEYVIHMTGGICKVKAIEPLNMSGADKDRDYYLLVPIKERGSKVYVPTDNESAIRRVYTPEEARKLIDDIPLIDEIMIENEKLRETRYREVIKSCDLRDLVGIIKNLNGRRLRRISEGKKSTATDDKYYKIAEENLYSELAFALNIQRDELKKVISQKF